jgi:hypothetical protein
MIEDLTGKQFPHGRWLEVEVSKEPWRLQDGSLQTTKSAIDFAGVYKIQAETWKHEKKPIEFTVVSYVVPGSSQTETIYVRETYESFLSRIIAVDNALKKNQKE